VLQLSTNWLRALRRSFFLSTLRLRSPLIDAHSLMICGACERASCKRSPNRVGRLACLGLSRQARASTHADYASTDKTKGWLKSVVERGQTDRHLQRLAATSGGHGLERQRFALGPHRQEFPSPYDLTGSVESLSLAASLGRGRRETLSRRRSKRAVIKTSREREARPTGSSARMPCEAVSSRQANMRS